MLAGIGELPGTRVAISIDRSIYGYGPEGCELGLSLIRCMPTSSLAHKVWSKTLLPVTLSGWTAQG